MTRKTYIFNKLLNKRASEFVDMKDKTDPNKLIYNFKNEGKDFRNYQTPLKFFENFRDGDVDPKEVFKN